MTEFINLGMFNIVLAPIAIIAFLFPYFSVVWSLGYAINALVKNRFRAYLLIPIGISLVSWLLILKTYVQLAMACYLACMMGI